MDRIDEIRQRCDAATPGPWHTEKIYHDEPGYEKFIKSARVSTERSEDGSASTVTMNNWSNPAMYDLEFIAHSRDDIPYLLTENERLKAENKRLDIEDAKDALRGDILRGELQELTARAEKAEAEREKAAEFIRWVDDNFSRYMPQEYTDRLMALECGHFKPPKGE